MNNDGAQEDNREEIEAWPSPMGDGFSLSLSVSLSGECKHPMAKIQKKKKEREEEEKMKKKEEKKKKENICTLGTSRWCDGCVPGPPYT